MFISGKFGFYLNLGLLKEHEKYFQFKQEVPIKQINWYY